MNNPATLSIHLTGIVLLTYIFSSAGMDVVGTTRRREESTGTSIIEEEGTHPHLW